MIRSKEDKRLYQEQWRRAHGIKPMGYRVRKKTMSGRKNKLAEFHPLKMRELPPEKFSKAVNGFIRSFYES